MKVVIPIVLARTNLRAASPRPERVARRAITFAPEHDTMVVVDRLIDSRSDRANPVAA